MTILEQAKQYYFAQSQYLDSFLETTEFLDTNSKYSNSVVIKFGANKLIGEISVWKQDKDGYIEFDYADLTKLENDPVNGVKKINSDTIIEELTKQFDTLRKLGGNNNL
jgi:hypothetical protein